MRLRSSAVCCTAAAIASERITSYRKKQMRWTQLQRVSIAARKCRSHVFRNRDWDPPKSG